MYPILEHDFASEAKVEPSRVIKPRDVPEHCVISFFREVNEKIVVARCARACSGWRLMPAWRCDHEEDGLFLQSPLTALGMGAVLAIFWGPPPLILARRRGLEPAVAFHWLQDALRFLAGF